MLILEIFWDVFNANPGLWITLLAFSISVGAVAEAWIEQKSGWIRALWIAGGVASIALAFACA